MDMEAKRRRTGDMGPSSSEAGRAFDVRAWMRERHSSGRLEVGKRTACFRKIGESIDIRSPGEARPPVIGEPLLGADLNEGLEDTKERIEEKRRRKCDLPDPAADNPVDPVAQAVGPVPGDVVTYRNNLNKIGYSLYNDRDPWQLDAAVVENTLYLDIRDPYPDDCPPVLQHYGYSLEKLLTGRAADEEFCSVTTVTLGTLSVHVAAEIDAEDPEEGFVEIKCAIMPKQANQQRTYNNVKLCKFWLQSALVNVPWVLVCFRSQAGFVEDFQWLRTIDIPSMAQQAGARWADGLILKFIEDVLHWLTGLTSGGHQVRATYDPKAKTIRAEYVDGDMRDRVVAARSRGKTPSDADGPDA